MTALTSEAGCSVSRKLIELLEEARGPCADATVRSFRDRLDAFEVEALENGASGATLVMIRVAREAVEFAERIAARTKRSHP